MTDLPPPPRFTRIHRPNLKPYCLMSYMPPVLFQTVRAEPVEAMAFSANSVLTMEGLTTRQTEPVEAMAFSANSPLAGSGRTVYLRQDLIKPFWPLALDA